MTGNHIDRVLAALTASTGSEADNAVDELVDLVAEGGMPVSPRAEPALLAALNRDLAPMSRREVIRLLGDLVAPVSPQQERIVDALAEQFHVARDDAFLGPEVLNALSKLAVRSPLARGALRSVLLRLHGEDTRFLLVRAAKILGSFAARGVDLDVGDQLEQWSNSPDLAVQAEARLQGAVVDLAQALRVDSLDRLEERLTTSRRALLAAETLEEVRSDATRLLALVDLIRSYVTMRRCRNVAALGDIYERAMRLRDVITDPYSGAWPGYADGPDALVEHRLFQVATAFSRLAETLARAQEWTDLDAALLETVAALRLMLIHSAENYAGALSAIQNIGENIGGRPLGLFLSQMVGRTRFARVLARWEAIETAGDDRGVVAFLRPLYAAVESAERAGLEPSLPPDLDIERMLRLAVDQPALVATLCEALPALPERLREAGLQISPDGADLKAYRMPIDAPDLYGGDPAVDDTVRPLLHEVWARVAPRFPLARWNRLREVLVFLIQLARDLRNDLPAFALAREDGGLGQDATEGDLQRYVFDELRRRYGRPAVYESVGFSGGRADSGLQFEDFTLPIEVKAEHNDVRREQIRASYLGQPHRYASDRDGIAVLLVLDLRGTNTAGHKTQRKSGSETSGNALYSLRDSFWIDALTEDPQVAVAHPGAVIVGLVPGNQPQPSSLTRYSRRRRRRAQK